MMSTLGTLIWCTRKSDILCIHLRGLWTQSPVRMLQLLNTGHQCLCTFSRYLLKPSMAYFHKGLLGCPPSKYLESHGSVSGNSSWLQLSSKELPSSKTCGGWGMPKLPKSLCHFTSMCATRGRE